jgi:hypothetical protein
MGRLNPIPLAIGLGVLLLLIALFFFQRRRAKATRRVSRRRKATKPLPADTAAGAITTPMAVEPIRTESIGNEVTPASAMAAGTAASLATSARPLPQDTPATEVGMPVKEEAAVVRPKPNGTQAAVVDQVKHVIAGETYDESIIGARDSNTRRMVSAELLASLASRNQLRRDRARDVFMKYGYFDDATRDLRLGASPAERASAARRLSFVRDRDATPHLIGALEDPSPEVRRAAVEAFVDAPDPGAIAPLNRLAQVETNRKVPQILIRHAIEACATSSPEPKPVASSAGAGMSGVEFPPPVAEQEREVIEL